MKTKKAMGMKEFPISQNREGVEFRNGVPGASVDLSGILDEDDLKGLGGGTGTGVTPTADELAKAEAAKQAAAEAKRIADEEEAKKRAAGAGAETAEEKAAREAKELADKKAAEDAAKAVTVDGITYKLDDKGNAINDKGEVVHTKEQLDSFTGATEEEPVWKELVGKYGIHPVDEHGKPKVYTDSVESIAELTKDIATVQAEAFKQEFLTQNPKLVAYAQHLALGRPDADFFNQVKTDWKEVKLTKEAAALQRSIITTYLTQVGSMPQDEAEELAKTYDENGKAFEVAQKYQTKLVEIQDKVEAQRKKDYEDSLTARAENYQKYLSKVEEIVVKTGQLQDFTIPEVERKAFYDYVTKPVKQVAGGWLTQQMIDEDNDPTEVDLQLAFLRFKKFKISDLVSRSVATAKARDLRSRIAGSGAPASQRMGSGQAGDGGKEKLSLDEIDLSKMV